MQISDNGRYFIGSDGKPVFWLGDTQWQLFRSFSKDDALMTLQNRNNHGFSFIQIMLLGVDMEPNINGDEPFLDSDPLRPNEAYFQHIDLVLDAATAISGLSLVIGVYHMRYQEGCFTEENARAWGRWLGERYKGFTNIVWSMYPAARPEYYKTCSELAAGLREGDQGAHLITVHPDPSPATSGTMYHDEDWLSFNSIQTFREVERIFPMTYADYMRTPAKPVVMAEGAYEGGIEYGFDVTPLWIRRQAYYSYFAGGHHSYGHNDSWRLEPTWREALNAPGAVQMGVLKSIFLSIPEWWELIHDESLLASGGKTEGKILTLSARHSAGRWAAVYAAEPTEFVMETDNIVGSGHEARWIDPRDGTTVESARVKAGKNAFTSPDGLEDALLIVTESR